MVGQGEKAYTVQLQLGPGQRQAVPQSLHHRHVEQPAQVTRHSQGEVQATRVQSSFCIHLGSGHDSEESLLVIEDMMEE